MNITPFPQKIKKGFTMIEILVVMAIIAILMTIGLISLRNISEAKGVSAAMPFIQSTLREAQTLAKSEQVKTRVLFHADDTNTEVDKERYLRYVFIMKLETDINGNEEWILTKPGYTLPPKAFLDLQWTSGSQTDTGADARGDELGAAIHSATAEGLNGFVDVDLPGYAGGTETRKCYYVQFNASGLLEEPESTTDTAARIVLNGGRVNSGTSLTYIPSNAKEKIDGVIVWRSGQISRVRNLNDIYKEQ